MKNNLMNYEIYTKPHLINILEAKANIYIGLHGKNWMTLQSVLPTGYKRLPKAEIIDEIHLFNERLGINKAKPQDEF